MKNRWILISMLIGGVFLLASCQSNGVSYKKDDYVIPLDVDFKSSQDLFYFDMLADGENFSADDLLQDGAVVFISGKATGAIFKARINYDTALHVRWKMNAADSCHIFRLMPYVDQETPLEGGYFVGVSGCSYQSVQANNDRSLSGSSLGTIVMDEGKWLDAVFWVEDEGTPVFRAFVWETEKPEVFYAEKLVLAGQEEAGMYQFSIDLFSGSIAIDSLRLAAGEPMSYLWFSAPAFSDNYEKVAELFGSAQ